MRFVLNGKLLLLELAFPCRCPQVKWATEREKKEANNNSKREHSNRIGRYVENDRNESDSPRKCEMSQKCSHHRLKWAYKLVVSNTILDAWLSPNLDLDSWGREQKIWKLFVIRLTLAVLFRLFCDFFEFQLHYYLHIVCVCARVWKKTLCASIDSGVIPTISFVTGKILGQRSFLCSDTPTGRKSSKNFKEEKGVGCALIFREHVYGIWFGKRMKCACDWTILKFIFVRHRQNCCRSFAL